MKTMKPTLHTMILALTGNPPPMQGIFVETETPRWEEWRRRWWLDKKGYGGGWAEFRDSYGMSISGDPEGPFVSVIARKGYYPSRVLEGLGYPPSVPEALDKCPELLQCLLDIGMVTIEYTPY